MASQLQTGNKPLQLSSSARRRCCCRRRCVQARASEGFCRDKVAVRKDVKSEGKVCSHASDLSGSGSGSSMMSFTCLKPQVYKLTFVAAKGDARVIECPDDVYILDAAEQAGLDLPNTCRGGICGACVARVASGQVDQSDIPDLSFTLDEGEQAKGMALLCMARAASDCEIETQCDWGYSLGVGEWKGASGLFANSPDPLMGTEWNKDVKDAAGVKAVKF
ncbi:hypothetical protein QJQ45_029735 [Haematococcus lacustris]|nr:hypothetical protein QJQ45_029735 [Haematococcus lacustris]